jgi:uncharacterized protein YqgV (UPF0045/DUF77 family)
MIVTLEISMYPLQENYHDHILEFLHKLHKFEGLSIKVNALSTQIQGEQNEVMRALQESTTQVFEAGLKASFVMKLLPGEIDLDYQHK